MYRQEMEERVAKLNEKISQLKESGVLEKLVQPYVVEQDEKFVMHLSWKITETPEKDCLLLTLDGNLVFAIRNEEQQWLDIEDNVSVEHAVLDLFPQENLVERINQGLEEEISKYADAIKALVRVLVNR